MRWEAVDAIPGQVELIEVKGYDFATQAFVTEDLYRAEDNPLSPAMFIHTTQPQRTKEEVQNATARDQAHQENHRPLHT